jgi:hypothetical protein
MKRKSLLFILIYFVFTTLYSQNARQVNIRNVAFSLNTTQKVIEINYDIEYNTVEDSVYILVQDKKSVKYKATSLQGDVGLGVKPGQKKKIIWDFIADNFQVNEEIGITVFVKLNTPYKVQEEKPTSVYKPETEPVVKNEKSKKDKKNKTEPVAKTETPKIDPIKPPKEKGKINTVSLLTFGVGILGGGYMVFLGNQKQSLANKYYESYKANNWNQTVKVTADSWLTQYSDGSKANADRMLAVAQDTKKTGQTIMYAGIGIIVADAIMTIPRFRKKASNKVAFKPMYNPNANLLSLNLNYKF